METGHEQCRRNAARSLCRRPLPFTRLRAAVDDLYPRLLEAILEQRITPASRFTEDSLKQWFGASRADVRRVLTQLAHEHIVVLRANHRPRIAAPDSEQTRQPCMRVGWLKAHWCGWRASVHSLMGSNVCAC